MKTSGDLSAKKLGTLREITNFAKSLRFDVLKGLI